MKKINGKKLLKNFVIALLGAIIGYLLYYSVIMDAIPLFIESSGIKYTKYFGSCYTHSRMYSCFELNHQ